MNVPPRRGSDNTLVRVRGKACIVASATAPFTSAYWPDVELALKEIGLPGLRADDLQRPEGRERFLTALTEGDAAADVFAPARLGFAVRPEDIRLRTQFRERHLALEFVGQCSSSLVMRSLVAVGGRLPAGGELKVGFRKWDLFADWPGKRETVNEVFNYFQPKRLAGSVLMFSALDTLPDGAPWYIYNSPRLRIGWVASELAACTSQAQWEQHRSASPALRTLEELSSSGAWPHVVLPATSANAAFLPDLVLALGELTRGATIDVIPAPLLLEPLEASAPSPEEFVAALLAIYRDRRLPLRRIGPLSWVALRINNNSSLLSSSEAAGATVAVLENGDVYAGEAAAGLDDWWLGNVLKDGEHLHWERLDTVPEVFSFPAKPQPCRTCDWRYRCGGVDCSVHWLAERRQGPARTAPDMLFELYCAPRKALFEESLWDAVGTSAERQTKPLRERIEVRDGGITLVPAPDPR